MPRFHGDLRWGILCTFRVEDANHRTMHTKYTSDIGEIIPPRSLWSKSVLLLGIPRVRFCSCNTIYYLFRAVPL